jgi:hypothetical protein
VGKSSFYWYEFTTKEWGFFYTNYSYMHRWALASRKPTPASAFRHPSSQSGTGPSKCRTASLYSGTGQGPASLVFSSPVPDHPDVGQSGIPVDLIVHIFSFGGLFVIVILTACGFKTFQSESRLVLSFL